MDRGLRCPTASFFGACKSIHQLPLPSTLRFEGDGFGRLGGRSFARKSIPALFSVFHTRLGAHSASYFKKTAKKPVFLFSWGLAFFFFSWRLPRPRRAGFSDLISPPARANLTLLT